MNRTIPISVLFCLCMALSFGRDQIDITPYINAWKTKDKTQTIRFEETLVFFTGVPPREAPFSEKHLQVIEAAEKYLKSNPDKRISAKLLLYKLMAQRTAEGITEEHFLKAISDAYELHDRHLLSELYREYARYKRPGPEFIIYAAKAVKIQEEIGAEYFPYYCTLLFDMLATLHHSNEFEKSIAYGEKLIECGGDRVTLPMRNVYIMDIMGANYYKLGDYDKAYYYNKKILDTLKNGDQFEDSFRFTWEGIAKASIGQILFAQDKAGQSIPYLQSALDITLEAGIWNTAASAQHVLAKIAYNNGAYETALQKWKEAYGWILKSTMAIQEPLKLLKYQISGSIADAYYKLNNIDSAFYYQERAHEEQLVYEKSISERNFELITANLNFEEARNNLEISHQRLKTEKTLRNGILAGTVLLGIISLLVLNQRRLRTAYKHRMLVQEKALAEERAEEARKNIALFKKNMAEKERLIETLRNNTEQEKQHTKDIQEKLLGYALVTEEEWLKFKDDFAKAYPVFLSGLRKIIDAPSPAEERLSCLISLNLSNAQIAGMLGIGTDSVARSKRRLKNRIALPDHVSLEEYICNLHNL